MSNNYQLDQIMKMYLFPLIKDLSLREVFIDYPYLPFIEQHPEFDLNTAFYLSIENGYMEFAEYFLDKGADIHYENELPVIVAATKGNNEMLEFLFNNGAEFSSLLPVKMAIKNGHLSTVKFFIDEDDTTWYLKELFDLAVAAKQMHIIQYLVEERGLTLSEEERYNTIKNAIRDGYLDIIQYLTEQMGPLPANRQSARLFEMAISMGRLEIARYLQMHAIHDAFNESRNRIIGF